MALRPVVLFLCSGNYYRSRFAELFFNARAESAKLSWRADSRGLVPDCFSRNPGPIAQGTLAALEARGIVCSAPHRFPLVATEEDLRAADRIIALKEAEHRPILQARFAAVEPRVEYWHIHDVDAAAPAVAIPALELELAKLMRSLGCEP
jgi:protein-tyrosine phosphatase